MHLTCTILIDLVGLGAQPPMYLHLPRGTAAVRPQLAVGRGSSLLTEDVKLSRQHALFSYGSGRASVLWMARHPGRLTTPDGVVKELTRGTQHELQHADRLALLAETGRHVVVVHLDAFGEPPVHPSAAEWKQFEAASKIEAMDAVHTEMLEQRQMVQALRSRHGTPSEDGWARSELAALDACVAAADSSDPSGSSEETGAAPLLAELAGAAFASRAASTDDLGGMLLQAVARGGPIHTSQAAVAPPVSVSLLGRRAVAAGAGGAASVLRAAGGAAVSCSGAASAASAIRAVGGAAVARLPTRLGSGRAAEMMRLPVTLHAVADATLEIDLDESNRLHWLDPLSEAALSGLRDGDQLVSFNGAALVPRGPRVEELLRRQFVLPGDAVRLVFQRPLEEHVEALLRGPREPAEPPSATRHFRLPGERSALDQAQARAAYRKHYRRPARDPFTNQLLGDEFSGYLRDLGEPLHQ